MKAINTTFLIGLLVISTLVLRLTPVWGREYIFSLGIITVTTCGSCIIFGCVTGRYTRRYLGIIFLLFIPFLLIPILGILSSAFNPFQDSLDEILRTVLCFSPICLLIFKNSNSELKLALLLFCSGLAIFLQFYRYFSILKHWHSQIHYWQIPRNFASSCFRLFIYVASAIQISRKFNRLAMRCHFNDFCHIYYFRKKVFLIAIALTMIIVLGGDFSLKKRLAVLLSVSIMLILGILLSLEFDVKLDGISSKLTNLWFVLFELDKVSDQNLLARIRELLIALELISQHPYLGVGIIDNESIQKDALGYFYFSDVGIVGLMAFYGIIGSVLVFGLLIFG